MLPHARMGTAASEIWELIASHEAQKRHETGTGIEAQPLRPSKRSIGLTVSVMTKPNALEPRLPGTHRDSQPNVGWREFQDRLPITLMK